MHGFSVSPATIRTIMADLEEMGYVAQPHTSAGRIPTDKGYRLYVDALMDRPRLSPAEVHRIEERVGPSMGEVGEILQETGKLLSALSPYVAVVLAPRLDRSRFRRVDFVSLARDQVMVILLADTDLVHHKVVSVDEAMTQEELDRIARYLTSLLQDHTLRELRDLLLAQMAEEKAQYDQMLARALRFGAKALEAETEADVFVAGAAHIADQPEFADIAKMKAIFAAFEEKSKLVKILNECLTGEDFKIFIGSEIPVRDIQGLSVIASPYRRGIGCWASSACWAPPGWTTGGGGSGGDDGQTPQPCPHGTGGVTAERPRPAREGLASPILLVEAMESDKIDTPNSPEVEAAAGPPEAPPGAEGSAESPEALREALAAKTQEAERLQERLLRMHAEFENYKKRMAREKAEFLKFAHEGLILEFLPVLDNLERAMASARAEAGSTPLLEGIEMIARLFRSVLDKAGVKPMQAIGQPFDPGYHQAVAEVEFPGGDANLVVEETQKGYLIEGRVLRPAMVKVSRAASSSPPGDGADSEGAQA
jgi:heat-inducible transcriptional repressor